MKQVLTLAVAGVSLAVSAAYVTPWYANPTITARVCLNAASPVPVDTAISADGTKLFVSCEANGSFNNLCVVDLARVALKEGANAQNVNSNACSTMVTSSSAGLGDAPRLAPRPNGVLGIDVATGAAADFSLASRNWVGTYAPEARTFSAPPAVSSYAFDAAGALWSPATGAGRESLLVKRTLSGSAFAEAGAVDTGLASVDAVAVYTVNGAECAFAAAQGKVVRVDLATQAVTTLVDDAAHLGAAVKSVRMSHTDYFRPRLYVLLETGDVAVYYLDETASTATWSKNFTNAELLAVALSQYAANEATVCALEVSPDGGTAYVAYRVNDGATVNGTSFMAVLKNTPPRWRYYYENEPGNPSPDGDQCMTDGHWLLWCRRTGGNDAIYGIGRNRNASDRAYANDYMGEILDLSAGCAFTSNNTKLAGIWGNYNYSLGTNAFGLQPRVIIHSTTINNNGSSQTAYEDVHKCWTFVEEVVLTGSPNFTKRGNEWGGYSKNVKRIVLNLEKLTTLKGYNIGTTDLNYAGMGGASDFSDINLPALQSIGRYAFAYMQCTGALDLPSVEVVSNGVFYGCDKMTAISLSAKKKTLQMVFNEALRASVAGAGHLKRVTLGCAEGCVLKGANIFLYQPIEDVILTGALPTFEQSVAWPDTAAQTMVFAVPEGDAAWDALIADGTKVKSRLSAAEQAAFATAHPGRPVPFGVVDKSVFHTGYDQYIAYNRTAVGGGCKLTIDRDTFFDDAVEVTSDWPACEDGTYTPGTTVTLTARPNATGTFRKWYGDIPRTNLAMRTSATISFVITNDMWLYARFVHPWTLAADKKTASNGNFTINCSVVNASQRTLKVGTDGWAGFYANGDTGQGILDLGGPIYLAGDATPWTFVTLPTAAKTWIAKFIGPGDATGLITPGTVNQNATMNQFIHGGSGANGRSYRLLIFDEPDMTLSWNGWTTCDNRFLTRMILELPKLTKFAGDGGLWSVPLTDTKFDWWDLNGMTSIGVNTWKGYDPTGGSDGSYGGSWKAPASGDLELPSMRDINTTGLSYLANIEGLSLGGKDKDTTITNICASAFLNDNSLKRLTLHASADIVVGTTPFTTGKTPEEIVFTGPAPATETALANLLVRVTAAEKKPVKVYASILQDGWTTDSYIDHNPTAAERAEAPGERVIGVYRGGAEAPLGKALIIYRKSRFDSPATYIILR